MNPTPDSPLPTQDRKAWYRRKRFVIPLAIAGVLVLGSLGSDDTTPATETAQASDTAAPETEVATTADEANVAADPTPYSGEATEPAAPDAEPTSVARPEEPTPAAEPSAEPTPAPAEPEPEPTDEPAEAETDEPVPTEAPATEVAEEPDEPVDEPAPAGPAPAFGDGTHVVGQTFEPGRYRAVDVSNCYWERLSDLSGDFDALIANDIVDGGSVIVDIADGDEAFTSQRCGDWYPIDDTPVAEVGGELDDGVWLVGVDVAPGRYTAPGGESCYWERLSSFSGDFDALRANDIVDGAAVVDIQPDDVGFSSQRCGGWTPAG